MDIDQTISDSIVDKSHLEIPNQNKGASVLNASGNIIKNGIGTGVLFMPYAFQQCGIILSIISLAIAGLISFYCWNQLCKILRYLEERNMHK